MKLAVFGGSGLAGSAIIELALSQGDEVRALIRPRSAPPAGLPDRSVVRGDALDATAVADTVNGTDAIITTLGGYRGPESLSVGTANIVAAMRADGIVRLVVLQGFHLHFPGDPHTLRSRMVAAYLDRQCPALIPNGQKMAELLLRTNDIAWTLFRIPRIAPGPPTGRVQLGTFRLGPLSSVRLGDLSEQLLTAARSGMLARQAPMLYTSHRRPPGDAAPIVRDRRVTH